MRTLFVLLAIGLLNSGCEHNTTRPEAATIPPDTFARILAELSVARVQSLPDTLRYHRRRAEILQAAGVTEADLRAFVVRRGGDADLMTEIYERVGARLDSTAQR